MTFSAAGEELLLPLSTPVHLLPDKRQPGRFNHWLYGRSVVRFLYGRRRRTRNLIESRPESAFSGTSKYFSYKKRTTNPVVVEISQFSLF
jgi:hypothetical protein